eukprot:Hpha_TRINITY_DN3979_c0_g1::TRINITY_DN3979_c0_g1_i1::g.18157::m.18157
MVKQVGRWKLLHTLGQGSFGEVRLVEAQGGTKEQAACKVCAKQALVKGTGRAMLEREIAVQKALQHPNVLRLVDVLETAKHFYLVIELATGGELFDLIQDHKRFNEDTSRDFFQQLIMGVRYCHAQGVVHRDLKPQNLLLTGRNQLKIADFGFSNFQQIGDDGKVTPMLRLQTCCGTPNYAAPEIFLGKGYSGFCTDVWSCGVILYVMMVGHVPFRSDGKVKGLQGVIIAICEGRYTIPSALSEGAQDIIRRILTNDPKQRATIEDIIAHPWFAVNFNYQQVLQAVPKMNLSDDMIRQSICPVTMDDDGGDDIVSPTAAPGGAAWGSQEEIGVLDALPPNTDGQLVSDGSDQPSQEQMAQLPQEKVFSFDEHGTAKQAANHCLREAAAEEAAQRTPHDFSKSLAACLCFYCGKFIYGQGMKCRGCSCPVHIKCVSSASEYTYCEQYKTRAKG